MKKSNYLLLCSILIGVFFSGTQAKITFYTKEYFKGNYYESNATVDNGCLNLPSFMDDKVNAIHTNGGCVTIYDEKECKGGKLIVAPGTYSHHNMVGNNFGNKASSFRICVKPEYSFYAGTSQRDHLLDYSYICGCTNLPDFAVKRMSSINSNKHCLRLYSVKNCEGTMLEVTREDEDYHGNLDNANFDDMVASINVCGEVSDNCGKDNNSSCAQDQISCRDGACFGMDNVCDEVTGGLSLEANEEGDGGWILAVVIVGASIALIAILISIVYLYKKNIYPNVNVMRYVRQA